MLQLFRPRCPCYPLAKEWVETRLSWIRSEFRQNVFNGSPTVLPTDDFFPDSYDSSQESARLLLRRVCEYIGVRHERVILRFKHDPIKTHFVNAAGQYLAHSAGTYVTGVDRYYITIDTDELARPKDLIGTFAHELSHARLIGERRISGREFDNELLTDLTALALGFGIFMANSPRHWDSAYKRWPGTDLQRPEYMIPPMYGYALAHLAWFEGEMKPAWAEYLGPACLTEFKEGVRYLFKTGETSFRPRPRSVGPLSPVD